MIITDVLILHELNKPPLLLNADIIAFYDDIQNRKESSHLLNFMEQQSMEDDKIH